ncbi:MAG TPA: hypothetical protein VIY49_05000 [Bryobacteraceae bacterium]
MESIIEFLKTNGVKLDLLVLQISVILIVTSIGISATWQDAMFLFRNPSLLFRSVLARNVIVPCVAVAMIKAFTFHPAVEITIAVLAATPVPPILPSSLLRSGGRHCYVLGLLASQAVLAIIIVPLIVRVMDSAFPGDLNFSVRETAAIVLRSILVPLAAGLVAGRLLPDNARQFGRLIARLGNVLLVCAVLPLFVFAWTAFQTLVGEGLLLGLALMIFAGLAAGHLLGGPDENDRTVLALATSAAHPGVAIAIAKNFPDQTKLVAGAVVIYLVLRAILVIPYVRMRRRSARYPGGTPVAERA